MDCEYHFWADALNKFPQLTPWIQAVVFLGAYITVVVVTYLIKEMVAIIANACRRKDKTKPPASETLAPEKK